MEIGKYKRCNQCKGNKTHSPLGFMSVRCESCNGNGYTEFDFNSIQVDVANEDSIVIDPKVLDQLMSPKELRIAQLKQDSLNKSVKVKPLDNELLGMG